ncbi:MAG: NAD-dependent epimerase/dehydratase family protein [Candidatus Acidiferrales bacterium]
MKVLVTGAAGFIGSHVVDTLCSRGAEVIGLDSLDPGVHHQVPSYLNAQATYCFADLRTWQPDDRFDDVTGVVHLAALGGVGRASREPVNVLEANGLGTARLAQAARAWPKLRSIVLGSSFSIYGSSYAYRCGSCGTETDGTRQSTKLEKGIYEVLCPQCDGVAEIQPITESACPAPLEIYGVSKYMQELCFRGFDHCPVRILRFSSVYGKRLRLEDGEATIIARLAGWIQQGISPKLLEDGRQIRDWVYVGDLVDAIAAMLVTDVAPPIVNVCSGIPTRLGEACEHIARAVGHPCRAEIVGGYRAGDMRHCLGDSSRLEHLIQRKPISLTEGARLAFGG